MSIESATPNNAAAVQRVANRIGCTEGQLYTMVIGITLATVLAVLGIPTALRAHPALASPTAAAPAATPMPSTTTAPAPVVSPPSIPPPLPQTLGPAVAPTSYADTSSTSSPPPLPPVALPAGTISLFTRIGNPGAPAGIATSSDGTVAVATNNGSAAGRAGPSVVFLYDHTGRMLRKIAVAGQPAQHANGIVAATTDSSGRGLFVDASTGRVLSLTRGARALTVRATVPDVPLCLLNPNTTNCESGVQDHPPALAGIAVDSDGTIYVSDSGQGIIWRLRKSDRTPQVWYSSTDLTTGDGPAGLGFDVDGQLLFTAGSTLDTANPGNGGLYRLEINTDRTAGTRTLVHAFANGDRPGALTVGALGGTYVVLRGSGSIVSLDSSGTETGQITPPGHGSVALDTPAGLVLTAGHLLISNQASSTPAHWAVLDVAVHDRPLA